MGVPDRAVVTAANVGLAVRRLRDGEYVNRDMQNALNGRDDVSSVEGMIIFAFSTGVRACHAAPLARP